MQNWILFPDKNTTKNVSQEESIEMLLYLLGQDQRCIVSKDEWHEFIPESKKKLQENALGFFCGDLPGRVDQKTDLYEGLPEVGMRQLSLDHTITNQALDLGNNFSLPFGINDSDKFLYFSKPHFVITVAGMFKRERSIFVRGSKITRFSKYKVPKQEPFIF